MATNDDERREVADDLRHQAKRLGLNMDAHEFANYVPDVIDPEYELRWDQMMLHLADLIDRPTYRPVIPDAMEGNVFCPQCGAEIGEYGVPNYCHSCGMAIRNA